MSDRTMLLVLLFFMFVFFGCNHNERAPVPPYVLLHTCKELTKAESSKPSARLCEARREIYRLRKAYYTSRLLMDILSINMSPGYDEDDEDMINDADEHVLYDATTGAFAPLPDDGCDESDDDRDVFIDDFPMNTKIYI